MIQRLDVQGLALIDKLSIEFQPGFNVLTGETGAGKSILIRALHLLAGQKAQADWVRKGESKALLSAEFSVPSHHPSVVLLANHGIPVEMDSGTCSITVRRQLIENSKSSAWINDVSVTTTLLKQVGQYLIDVFQQHENQKLLHPENHLYYLDAFLDSVQNKKTFLKTYQSAQQTLKEISELKSKHENLLQKQDYLQFRLEEVQKFSPSVEDYEYIYSTCSDKEKALGRAENYQSLLKKIEGDQDQEGASLLIQEALRLLSSLASRDEKFTKHKENLEEVSEKLENVIQEVSQEAGELSIEPQELEDLQNRLFQYQELMRKFSVRDVGALVEAQADLEKEMKILQDFEGEQKILEKKFIENVQELKTLAKNLTLARTKAAKQMKTRVEQELQDLSMAQAQFQVEITDHLPKNSESQFKNPAMTKALEDFSLMHESGMDRVQFLLSANKGEVLMPLAKVASGGELSRIFLALKKALAVDADTCVLVFDEIDTGISGRVADTVGQKLKSLSDQFQILCISHLPQVAVYADQHYVVEKYSKDSRSFTRIYALGEKESLEEIARLLSADQVSKVSINNAKVLKDTAQKKSKKANSKKERASRDVSTRL